MTDKQLYQCPDKGCCGCGCEQKHKLAHAQNDDCGGNAFCPACVPVVDSPKEQLPNLVKGRPFTLKVDGEKPSQPAPEKAGEDRLLTDDELIKITKKLDTNKDLAIQVINHLKAACKAQDAKTREAAIREFAKDLKERQKTITDNRGDFAEVVFIEAIDEAAAELLKEVKPQ